jgi:hypothetical protein
MIPEKTQRLADLLERKIRLQAHERNLNDFEQRRDQIQTAVNALAPLVKAWNIFRSKGLITVSLRGEVASPLQTLGKVLEDFSSNPGNILDNRRFNFRRDLGGCLENIRQLLEQNLQQTWRSFTEEKIRSIRRGNLEVFRGIPGFQEGFARIQNLLNELEERQNTYPLDIDQFDAFEAIIEEVHQESQDLGSEEISEEVATFLMGLRSGGAPVDSLTDDVANWLREHNIYSSLRIIAAS